MDPLLDEDQSPGTGFDPMVLLRIFLRRKLLFIIPFVLCSAMAAVVIRTQTPIYFSSGQIHVIYETTSATTLPSDISRYSGRRERDRDSQVYRTIDIIITGPKFLEGVVRDFRLRRPDLAGIPAPVEDTNDPIAPEENRAIGAMARRLSYDVRVQRDATDLYRIGVRDTDPERAYVLAQIVLDRFLEEERASRLQPAASVRDFLEKQREAYERDLLTAQQRYNSYQRSMLSGALVGNPINENNLSQAENALSRLRSQYFETEAAEMFEYERAVQSLLGQLPDVSRLKTDSEIATILRELTDLEVEEALNVPDSEGVGERENDLGSLRIHLNSLLEQKNSQVYSQFGVMERNRVTQYCYYRLYRDVRQQVINRIASNIDEFREFQNQKPEQSAELSRLQQDIDTAREMLNAIRHDISQENMRLQASMSEIGYKMVVRRDPRWPSRPIEPDRRKLYFMGFVFALAIGGGLVVAAQLLDRSFHSVQEIEKVLGMQVIGTLPMVENEYFQKRRMRRIWLWVLVIVVVFALAADNEKLDASGNSSGYAIQNLKT